MAYVLHTVFNNILFLIFFITFTGYLFGKIEIRGVGMGTAGVFLAAILFGHLGYSDSSFLHTIGLITLEESSLKSAMSMMQNLGLLCFVTSVGFIAGPRFFHNLVTNIKSYALLAFIIIGSAALTCTAIILYTNLSSAMAVGIFSGALTTTPGFAAAQDALQGNEALLKEIIVGHAVAYPFGVIGVVLFVQLVPRILRVNIEHEAALITGSSVSDRTDQTCTKRVNLDPIGLAPFSLAIMLGIFVGKISIPLPGGTLFSLGNTGGALIVGLILGHFGHIGILNMSISEEFLKSFREFGLILFLIGAGVPGGSGFVEIIHDYGIVLFFYGMLMEIVPLLIGFLAAFYLIKLSLFNNLGAITGGMTSTPALGALIHTAGTDDVAAAYAATYPIALVLVVLASQFMVMFL